MSTRVIAVSGLILSLGFAAAAQHATPPVPPPASARAAASVPAANRAAAKSKPLPTSTQSHAILSVTEQNQLVGQYCAGCHSEKGKAGGLSLAGFDAARIDQHAETGEKMARKLRSGMMPPAGARRPEDASVLLALAGALETRLDQAALANPNPGWRPFQRLTRVEYAKAVEDLLAVDVDVSPYLPPDTLSHGFDNIADAQSFSPALLEGYLRAASQVSRLAVGDREAAPTSATFRVLAVESQMRHVEGTPFGSQGGLSVVHTFPADGTYVFKASPVRSVSGELFANTAIAMSGRNALLEISIDGERAAVIEVHAGLNDQTEKGFTLETPPIDIKAGPHRIAAAFVPLSVGPVDDLIAPIDHTLVDTRIGTGFGITAVPHLQDLTVSGPMRVTGVSDTPSRRRIFSCRPTSAAAETACAADIVRRLATQAYRGPVGSADFDEIMAFYELGRNDGDFEEGVRLAVQAILANPRFLFRLEDAPAATASSAATARSHRIGDVELASRLSFFLWGTVPDADLVKVATAGRLKTPAVLEAQVTRMLADPRASALATRFGAQWLRLQDVEKIRPDGLLYAQWDRSLSAAFVRETELFFDSIVREDRPVLDLLTADDTFVNERLARHYEIPNVLGNEFRRVPLPATRRGTGVLAHGSILLQTSVADRTSPVQRGQWVMRVLLGSPPPPPPPNVPTLEATKGFAEGRVLSVRERMEQHRSNPACSSCHRVIDPIGLSFEHFDVTGQYRIKDNGVPVDASGELYDGTRLDGVQGLRDALLKRKDVVLATFTESLMTYALGRRVEAFDMPTVRAILRDAARHDYRMSAFILGVVNSPAFRMSRPVATATAAGDPLDR